MCHALIAIVPAGGRAWGRTPACRQPPAATTSPRSCSRDRKQATASRDESLIDQEGSQTICLSLARLFIAALLFFLGPQVG